MRISIYLSLPNDFRRDDFLAFHQRDSHNVAEDWENETLHKGIIWNTVPARLSFVFFAESQLRVVLDLDAGAQQFDQTHTEMALRTLASHMLGLNQDTQAFEQFALQHSTLKTIVMHRRGLRVPQSASPFEALTWAITGQQISLSAAISLRRKLIAKVGIKHSSGLLCYPGAEQVAQLSEVDLRECSYSATKARTLITLAEQARGGELPLTTWLDDFFRTGEFPAATVYNRLIGLRGVGPWTVDYALLRGFGWLDGSLHGDVAVRRSLQRLLTTQQNFQDAKISEREAQQWLASFSPWRALVAAHLWAMDT